jgi:hypothetical protein
MDRALAAVLTTLQLFKGLVVKHSGCARNVVMTDAVGHRSGDMMVVMVQTQHRAASRHDACRG